MSNDSNCLDSTFITMNKAELNLLKLQAIKDPEGTKQAALRALLRKITMIEGPEGPMGPIGPQGEQGLQGEQGESIVGPMGPVGPQGERGEQGIRGTDGQSIVGPQGIKGDKGDKGDRGEDGTPLQKDELVETVLATLKTKPFHEISDVTDLVNFLKRGGFRGGSGGGGAAVWGSITGTLSDQTDLQAALDLKAPLINPHFVSNGGFWITPTTSATSILLFDNITGANAIDLQVPITGSWTINMPNKNGTLAVTSDIGIKTLGGLSGTTQTFSGSGISIVSSGTNHAFTNDGVLSLNSPSGTITLSASTGAVDVDVNQASSYSWSGDHIFTANIDFTPVDSTSQFFDMNPDSGTSLPSRLRFLNNGGIMSSLEVNVDQGKDIRYLLPKDQPSTGQILYVSDWTDPVATLNWTTASGDVVGPASAASNEMTIFDGSTGKWIQGITAVSAGTLVTIGTNSVIYPNENVISVGTVSSTYTGSFSGSTNGANGLDIYNSNVGTSKITQILLRSGSTTGADTYGKILAYPTNYTNAGLAARFVIESGTSQQFVFQTDSNFEWRQNSTAIGKLTTTGFYAGSGSAHSTLQSGGSFARAYIAKTANYTLTINDSIVNCTANTFNITLPTAVGIAGREYAIKNVGTGVISMVTTSAQTIDGNASGTLTLNQWDSMVVASDGANWIIIK